jgi:mRNA interferase MazF
MLRGGIRVVDLTPARPSEADRVLLPAVDSGLGRDARAQAEQVRSVSVERVAEQLGNVPVPLMLDVDEALRLHLAL